MNRRHYGRRSKRKGGRGKDETRKLPEVTGKSTVERGPVTRTLTRELVVKDPLE